MMREKCRQIGQALWADIKSIKWGLLALLLYFVVVKGLFHEFCLMKILTGFPCPGCGATRACMLLLQFRWQEAFQMNPAIFLWVPYILYLLWQRYIGSKKDRRKSNQILLILVCLITMGIYVYGMTKGFPGVEPYTYYEGNLLKKCYPLLFPQ